MRTNAHSSRALTGHPSRPGPPESAWPWLGAALLAAACAVDQRDPPVVEGNGGVTNVAPPAGSSGASGVAVPSCTAGVACTPADPCHAGETQCTVQGAVCLDSLRALPDGALCGQGLACDQGRCMACANGACDSLPMGGAGGGSGGAPAGSGGAANVPSDAGGSAGGAVNSCDPSVNQSIDAQNNQDVVIARVVFAADAQTAAVTLRVLFPFTFGAPMQLCWGANDAQCVSADDGVQGPRPIGTDFVLTVGTQAFPVSRVAGELAFNSDLPSVFETFPFAYVNWGQHTSVDPDGAGPLLPLQDIAVEAGYWTSGDSIDLGTANAFFGNGATQFETGFVVCNSN
jgi:hypothetical protein